MGVVEFMLGFGLSKLAYAIVFGWAGYFFIKSIREEQAAYEDD